MTSKVRPMLESLYEAIARSSPDSITAWDRMVEFLAVDNNPVLITQLDHPFDWLYRNNDLTSRVFSTYDHKLMRTEFHDHLGDMYLEKLAGTEELRKRSLRLLDDVAAEELARLSMPIGEEAVTVLDPLAATGRLLMAASRRARNATLFGIEPDLRAVRIALTNFSIHGITGYILHGDYTKHATSFITEAGAENWGYANKWHSRENKLNPLPHLNQGFDPIVN